MNDRVTELTAQIRLLIQLAAITGEKDAEIAIESLEAITTLLEANFKAEGLKEVTVVITEPLLSNPITDESFIKNIKKIVQYLNQRY
jgi:hypothetical protein